MFETDDKGVVDKLNSNGVDHYELGTILNRCRTVLFQNPTGLLMELVRVVPLFPSLYSQHLSYVMY